MKFLMDYDNIPGKGPLMLFKDNGDGTLSLATVEDVEKAIKEVADLKDAQIKRLEEELAKQTHSAQFRRVEIQLEEINRLQAKLDKAVSLLKVVDEDDMASVGLAENVRKFLTDLSGEGKA